MDHIIRFWKWMDPNSGTLNFRYTYYNYNLPVIFVIEYIIYYITFDHTYMIFESYIFLFYF